MNVYQCLRSLCVLCMLAVAGCATPGHVVVLMPDPDGQVGEIDISNQGGSQRLAQANHAVWIRDRLTEPKPPVAMNDADIQAMFGAVLAAAPQLPEKFILYFRPDTIELTEDSRELLPEILLTIEKRRSDDISVVGHTDRMGTTQFNVNLSLERALAIRELLIKKGVHPSFIEATSHGEGNLLIVTDDDVAEPRNRRVEIIVR